MTLQLDGRNMLTREDAHREIAACLSFPATYGKNLDALWDLLTEIEADVTFIHAEDLLCALGDYGRRLLKTFSEAALENPLFHFEAIPHE